MKSFPDLVKLIRKEAGLTQSQFANRLGVSTILISMIETGQKEVSKKFVLKLAEALGVHPVSVSPFLFGGSSAERNESLSSVEASLIAAGEKMQEMLISKAAKRL